MKIENKCIVRRTYTMYEGKPCNSVLYCKGFDLTGCERFDSGIDNALILDNGLHPFGNKTCKGKDSRSGLEYEFKEEVLELKIEVVMPKSITLSKEELIGRLIHLGSELEILKLQSFDLFDFILPIGLIRIKKPEIGPNSKNSFGCSIELKPYLRNDFLPVKYDLTDEELTKITCLIQ